MTLASLSSSPPVIVWFRNDLRLSDNPALTHAMDRPIIPVFIFDEEDPHLPGLASRWWLHQSLVSLHHSLAQSGLSLVLRRGKPLEILQDLVMHSGASGLLWNRCYTPHAIRRDQKIKAFFKDRILCHSFNATLLAEPWELLNQSGKPYQIFTPYWKALQNQITIPPPLPAPSALECVKDHIFSESLENWKFQPSAPDWSQGFKATWTPGEPAAHQRLDAFLAQGIAQYATQRNVPGLSGTSGLSPHLQWGEISPRQMWHATLAHFSAQGMTEPDKDAWTFLSEIAWREFSYYLLYHFPDLPSKPLRSSFNHFPWRDDVSGLVLWQKGLTGYPLVDAGMRQLWHSGWMHNRVRMITASFLVKDLLIPWQEGAKWFWDTLVDADLASNSAGWQWVAGCGTDAAPYFRIFNPILQGQKYDPQGAYIRQWVPELARLSDTEIHAPWTISPARLRQADVRLGETYPLPIVDHEIARPRALAALKQSQSS